MPIYCYECEKCGTQREVLMFTVDDILEVKTQCNHCGGETKKIPVLSSFRLKGYGWAKDNYSKGGKNG